MNHLHILSHCRRFGLPSKNRVSILVKAAGMAGLGILLLAYKETPPGQEPFP